jgi:hypothetical protein
VTVVIGVVTVAAGPVGVVTVTAVIGVLTVADAVTVTGDFGIGAVGTETVGSRSVAGTSDEGADDGTTLAVDERTDAGVATPPEPCVEAGAALTAETAILN